MTKLQKLINSHKKLVYTIGFAFAVLLGCCIFPIYNFTADKMTLNMINLIISVFVCKCIGDMESFLFPNVTWRFIGIVNIGVVLAGMTARYWLEYGEISNTYNFTLVNMVTHILVMTVLCTLEWNWNVEKRKELQG